MKSTTLSIALLLVLDYCNAFSVQKSSRPARVLTIYRPSTCLYAEEENAAEPPPAEDAAAAEQASSSNDDILNSPAFLKRKLEVLRTDITKLDEAMEAAKQRLEQGKAEWGPQIDELAKEYKQIQERFNAKSGTEDGEATLTVAKKMLDFFDNFDRAFAAVTPETEEQTAIEAEYKRAYEMASSIFKELGVEEIPTVGQEFDYEFHQAVMQRPSDEFEEGFVCEELQKGYKIGEQLVRPAMVIVTV